MCVTQEVQCMFVTNSIVVNTSSGGGLGDLDGLGGRTAASALGEKNAMLGTVIRVMLESA